MGKALDGLALALQAAAPVLLRAELGSEVEVLARWAHECSHRGGPYIALPCPLLVDLPVETLSRSRGGTLFLNGVAELGGGLQERLVHVLDRLAANETLPYLVSASSRDLEREVAWGNFRQDLFFRLAVVDIRIPPLRERREDILPLARELVRALGAELGRRGPVLSPAAEALLTQHGWPGNLFELRNLLERAVMTATSEVIGVDGLPELFEVPEARRPGVGDSVTLRALESAHIAGVLARTHSLSAAAATLGVSRSRLSRWRTRQRDQP